MIRYDNRDTGRSVAYEPGHPGYTGADMVADAAGVLDAYGIPAAHIVGVSAGGAFAQLLALDFADRVLTLVRISTTAALPGDRALPPPTEEFGRFGAALEVDWSEPESVIDYLVDYTRYSPEAGARSMKGHSASWPGARSSAHATSLPCRTTTPFRMTIGHASPCHRLPYPRW